MIILRIEEANTGEERVIDRIDDSLPRKLKEQRILGRFEGYGFAPQTAENAVKIICDSKQCVSVTVKNKNYLLTLNNSNFNKLNRLKSTFDNPKTIDINLKIVDKSKEVENLKNILEIAEGRKPREDSVKALKKPRSGKVVRHDENRFVGRKWKPRELFEAIEGYGFDNKKVWSVFELMRDSEEIVQFQMENEEHRLTIEDFDNLPYFPRV